MLLKEKLHYIDKSGNERTYNLFSSPYDWYNHYSTTHCLHVITPSGVEGLCPLYTMAPAYTPLEGIYDGNITIYDKETSDSAHLTIYDKLVNIESNGLSISFSNYIEVNTNYGTSIYATIDEIKKNYAVDYDIIVTIYAGNGYVLYRSPTIDTNTISIIPNVQISSGTGFYWDAYIPERRIYRKLVFSPTSEDMYVQGAALAYVNTSPFTVTAYDYDGSKYKDVTVEFEVANTQGISPDIKRQVNGWDGQNMYYRGDMPAHLILLRIYLQDSEPERKLFSKSNGWWFGWFGGMSFDLSTYYFDELKVSGDTPIFAKSLLPITSTSTSFTQKIPLDIELSLGNGSNYYTNGFTIPYTCTITSIVSPIAYLTLNIAETGFNYYRLTDNALIGTDYFPSQTVSGVGSYDASGNLVNFGIKVKLTSISGFVYEGTFSGTIFRINGNSVSGSITPGTLYRA